MQLIVPNDMTIGRGTVLRDHDSDVVFSACQHLLNFHDAPESELSGIREGLSLAIQ